MKGIEFPICKTKMGEERRFDLTDGKDRQAYFEYKAGEEIRKLREYLKENTFVAYLLGKKGSGKGTYAKMLAEIVAPEKIAHFSVGDMVRSFDEVIRDESRKKELVDFLEKNYRGFLPLKDIMASLENRSTKVLLPSELILALVKREIAKQGKKAIFMDGFPRDMDQISYSLFFRDLIEYRDDPDIFVMIDVPESVIDARVKSRVICPLCQTSRNITLLPTKKAGYDEAQNKFYLICDNSECLGSRMVTKEGDEQGIEPIRKRLKTDEMLIKRAMELHGIPKVMLRNSMPIEVAKDYTDSYELTPEYIYSWEKDKKEVSVSTRPWQVNDDEGKPSNSLMPPPVVVSLMKQLVQVLGL